MNIELPEDIWKIILRERFCLSHIFQYTFYSQESKITERFFYLRCICNMFRQIIEKEVKTIYAVNSRINDIALRAFGNIEQLYLTWCCSINGSGFIYLKNLKWIDLSNCDVSCFGQNLKYLANVATVKLSDTEIGDAGLKYLIGVVNLYINNCPNITGSSFGKLTKLRNIYMSGCI